MTPSKSLCAFLTGLSFLTSSVSFGQATASSDTSTLNTGTAGFSVPSYNPAQLNMQMAVTSVQAAMAKCKLDSMNSSAAGGQAATKLTDILAKNKTKVPKKATGAAGGDCYAAKDDKYSCEMTCTEPLSLSKEVSCEKYFEPLKGELVDQSSGIVSTQMNYKTSDSSKLSKATSELGIYQRFLAWKSTSCESKDSKELKAQMAAYNCGVAALQSATSTASAQLQTVLQQNATQYGKMEQFQSEANKQIGQINTLLTGNPKLSSGGAQFAGLLGMQNALKSELPQMAAKEAELKNKSDANTKAFNANEQALTTAKMNQEVECMKGSENLGVANGYHQTCRADSKNVDPKTGKPALSIYGDTAVNCSGIASLRQQVESGAMITSRGVIRSQARKEKGLSNVNALDAVLNSVMRDMGAYDTATKAGGLVTRMPDWSTVQQSHAAEIASASREIGIDIGAKLTTIARYCESSAGAWVKQQKVSENSEYKLKLAELTAEKTALLTDLSSANTAIHTSYAQTMAVLGQAPVALTCNAATDPVKLASCYSEVRTQITNLVEGNGVSLTSKTITGGSLVGGFTVPCKGINGCVTTLQNVLTQKTTQVDSAIKAKQDFSRTANTQVQSQLTNFSQTLNQMQQSVAAQFTGMQALLQKMGVKSPAALKFMDPEQLESAETTEESGEKSVGPYKSPKNMAAVLSGLTQPTGLLDFKDTGINALADAAIEKADKDKTAAKEKSDKIAAVMDKLENLFDKCDSQNKKGFAGSGGGSRVGSSPSFELDCEKLKQMSVATGVLDSGEGKVNSLLAIAASMALSSTDSAANRSVNAAQYSASEIAAKKAECGMSGNTGKFAPRGKDSPSEGRTNAAHG